MILQEIIQSLREILDETDSNVREKLVIDFDNKMFLKDEVIENGPVDILLLDLATDLEYYDPFPEDIEDRSSYGDVRLEKEIKEVLLKIES
jgi:hypothetical protein